MSIFSPLKGIYESLGLKNTNLYYISSTAEVFLVHKWLNIHLPKRVDITEKFNIFHGWSPYYPLGWHSWRSQAFHPLRPQERFPSSPPMSPGAPLGGSAQTPLLQEVAPRVLSWLKVNSPRLEFPKCVTSRCTLCSRLHIFLPPVRICISFLCILVSSYQGALRIIDISEVFSEWINERYARVFIHFVQHIRTDMVTLKSRKLPCDCKTLVCCCSSMCSLCVPSTAQAALQQLH